MLPTNKQARKDLPIGTGVLDYFPLALAEVARVSKIGNDQHNPGEPLHWNRAKSQDESDAMIRHYMERYEVDEDGSLHAAKMAWRALAFLQKLCEDRATVGQVIPCNEPKQHPYGCEHGFKNSALQSGDRGR